VTTRQQGVRANLQDCIGELRAAELQHQERQDGTTAETARNTGLEVLLFQKTFERSGIAVQKQLDAWG